MLEETTSADIIENVYASAIRNGNIVEVFDTIKGWRKDQDLRLQRN